MMEDRKIKEGLYLVIDPKMKEVILIKKLKEILKGNQITAVQVWDNFRGVEHQVVIINKVCRLCHAKNIPVLLNNTWKLLKTTCADGVHFDEIPTEYREIRRLLPKNAITGLTCNNDLEVIKWANKNKIDYISFCSIFPSSTNNSCELVDFENIKKAGKLTRMPIFLAGGIKPENIQLLEKLDFESIAVVSGIMSAEKPATLAEQYNSELKKIKK